MGYKIATAEIDLQDPIWKGDVARAISNIAAASMEAHDSLDFQAMLSGLLEELYVGLEVVLLWAMPFAYSPPAVMSVRTANAQVGILAGHVL